jgi:hypothetical protein
MTIKKLFLQILISAFSASSFMLQSHAQIYQSSEYIDVKRYPLLDPDSISCIQESVVEISIEDKDNEALFLKNEQGETFFDLLLKMKKEKGLTAYRSGLTDDRFAIIMTLKDIEENLVEDQNSNELKIENIKSYEILKYDFYDLKKKLLLSRTISITPHFHKPDGKKQKVFCLEFAELTPLVFNYQISSPKGKNTTLISFFENNLFQAKSFVKRGIGFHDLKLGMNTYCFKYQPEDAISNNIESSIDIDPWEIAYGKLVEERISSQNPSNRVLFNRNGGLLFFDLIYWGYSNAGLSTFMLDNGFLISYKGGINDNDIGKENDTIIEDGQFKRMIKGDVNFENIKEYNIVEFLLYDKNNREIYKAVKYLTPISLRGEGNNLKRVIVCSIDYFELMKKTELIKRFVNRECNPHQTYYDFFKNMEYSGEVINEKRLSINDLMGKYNFLINIP